MIWPEFVIRFVIRFDSPNLNLFSNLSEIRLAVELELGLELGLVPALALARSWSSKERKEESAEGSFTHSGADRSWLLHHLRGSSASSAWS